MKNTTILFIDMDTRKETTDVAYVEEGHNNQPHYLGKFPSNKRSMEKLVRQFQSKYLHTTLYFVYEAGPYEYWLYRLLCQLHQQCLVVATSLITKKVSGSSENRYTG